MTIKSIEIQYDTLTIPRRRPQPWTWETRVTLDDGRVFLVSNRSRLGAYEGDLSREHVTAFLNGTLGTPIVREVK